MRIDLNSNAAVSEAHVQKSTSSHAAQTSEVQKNTSQAAETHASVGKLASEAMNAPEVRSEKVQALQSAIKAGTYHAADHQVADSMFEQMRRQSR